MKTKNKYIRNSVRRGKFGLAAVTALAGLAVIPTLVLAAPNTQLTQSIGVGTLVTDIRDASGASVANPSVAFSTVPFPFECLVAGAAPTATLGTDSERLYVDNPGAANNGWNLNIAASAETATWSDGATESYDYNDPTTDGTNAGCGDGADTDSVAGQLSIDPSGATLFPEGGASSTGITMGAASSFSEGVTPSINLAAAASGSDDYGRWYLTGVDMSQTIPLEQAAGSYTLDLTLDVVAN